MEFLPKIIGEEEEEEEDKNQGGIENQANLYTDSSWPIVNFKENIVHPTAKEKGLQTKKINKMAENDPVTSDEIKVEKERHQLTGVAIVYHKEELIGEGYKVATFENREIKNYKDNLNKIVQASPIVVGENSKFNEKMLEMNNKNEDEENILRSKSFKLACKVIQVELLHQMVIESNHLYIIIRKAFLARIGPDQQGLIHETKESLSKFLEQYMIKQTIHLLDHAKSHLVKDFITCVLNEKKKMKSRVIKIQFAKEYNTNLSKSKAYGDLQI